MWFKNLQLFRIPENWSLSPNDLAEQLGRFAFQPCSSLAMESRGWIPPRGDDQLVVALHRQWLIALGVEQKLLPASVVRQTVKERAAGLESKVGRKLGRKELRDLKEDTVAELLPRAFSRYRATFIWIDPTAGWLVVDAASPKKVEEAVDALRRTLDEYPVAPLKTERSPVGAMTEWLASGHAPRGFSIDQDCELRSQQDERVTVRYAHHPLDVREIREHIAGGKQVSRLALTWQARLSFVLTDKLEVKKLQFLEAVASEAGPEEASEAEQKDANFVLMTGQLAKFLPDLVEALGGEAAQG
jgi:recombination associated protein RdgC